MNSTMNKWFVVIFLGLILASACLVEGKKRGENGSKRKTREVSQKPPELTCNMDAQIKCGMALGACVPVCGTNVASCQKCFEAYGSTMWQSCCPCVKNIIPTVNC